MSFTSRWMKKVVSVPAVAVAAGAAVAFAVASLDGQQARKVDDATLLKPADADWVGYGRDYSRLITARSPRSIKAM